MSSRILKITSFVLFLLVNKKLRGVEHGENESKQLFSLYFCSIPRDYTVFLTRVFSCDLLCLSVILMKLSVIEEPSIRTNSC